MISWDEYFLDIAKAVAERSTCVRRRVGAVLVRDRHILTTGYNGVPRGITHCAKRGCAREKTGVPSGARLDLCRGVHAEMNALIQAALHGVTTERAVLFCTNSPCFLCAKVLINAGIKSVVIADEYPGEGAIALFNEADVQVVRHA